MFFRVGRENSDENAAKTAKISVVNANTPCISWSKHIVMSLLALAIQFSNRNEYATVNAHYFKKY